MPNATIARPPVGDLVQMDRDLMKALGAPAPGRLLLQTGIEWLCIVALVVLATWCANPLVSVLCMFVIATRQHALLVLMHEYSHYQLSRKKPWLNDLIGDVFTAFPLIITVHGFRRNHMPHHRNVSTDDDPDWIAMMKKDGYDFPKPRRQIFIELLKHCVGWYTLADLKGYTVDSGMAVNLPRSTRMQRVAFAVILVAAVSWFGLWGTVLLYWVLPMATFLMAILYLRDIGEHFGKPSAGIANARTVVAGWFERAVFCQNGANFHTEHHLFPGVPFFRLKQLHDALMEKSQYRNQAVVTRGYLSGLVDEISTSYGA